MKPNCLVLIFLAHFFMGQIHARRLDVCPEGCQFSTIKSAIAAAQAGDTIVVWNSPDAYREGEILVDKPLVLLGMDFPIIDGEGKVQPIRVRTSNATVSGFEIRNSGHGSLEDISGIKVENATNVLISNNLLENNFFGIYFANCRGCRVICNTVRSTASPNGNPDNNRDDHDAPKDFNAGNGIHCWKCDSMTIAENTLHGNRDGIYFEFVTNSQIRENFSEGNLRYGLHFMYSNRDRYEANIFQHNGAGVAVMYSHHVTMLGNRFEENQGAASYGLLLKDINDSHIEGNLFAENTCGIFMESAARSQFTANVFRENGAALKIQASCIDNVFEQNNFLANTFDVMSNSRESQNRFLKNYWDKYEGYDLNRDGTGDVPFHPVSLFGMIAEQMPYAMMLWRSGMAALLDRAERVVPSLTPAGLVDGEPRMRSDI